MVRDEFVAAAREYCRWAESPPAAPNVEAGIALRILLRLHTLVLDLDPAEGVDYDMFNPTGEGQRRRRVISDAEFYGT